MKSTKFVQSLLFVMLVGMPALASQANSVGFGSSTYSPDNGQLVVTVVYDFTDFGMFGGGFDLLYDAEALEFVSFTASLLPPDIWFWGFGAVEEPGRVTDLYLSNSSFFNGINSAAEYGTIVFNVLSGSIGDPGCDGFELCLVSNANNPLVSLAGSIVDDELLSDARARVVPLPAAFWLLVSGLALLKAQRIR